jgi:hypothetical protein
MPRFFRICSAITSLCRTMLNATPRLTQDDLQLPGTSISLQIDGPTPWSIGKSNGLFRRPRPPTPARCGRE